MPLGQNAYPVEEVAGFFGRTATAPQGNAVYFNWSGSGFAFRFQGTEAAAWLLTGEKGELPEESDRAYLGVFVDELPFAVSRFPLDRPSGWYTLAAGLENKTHTVRVVKQTEVGSGRAAVSQLACDGAFLTPPPPKPLRLEFIGDSITCGYGNLCSNESPAFVTREEDFSSTFAQITADLLGAEVSCVAASGNGFSHDYGCNTHNLIPQLYLYADKMLDEHYGGPARLWDFHADRRDAVILKLGQNDGQFCSGADLAPPMRTPELLAQRRRAFEESAFAFFRQVARLRPGTPVLYLYESDMLLRQEALCAAARAQGVIPVEIPPKRPWEGVGANGHWSACTHARVALQLSERIRELLC